MKVKRGWDAGVLFQSELADSLLYILATLGEAVTSRICLCDMNGLRSYFLLEA